MDEKNCFLSKKSSADERIDDDNGSISAWWQFHEVLIEYLMKHWLSTLWSTDWAPYEALIETLTKHWLKPSIGKKFRPWLKIQSFLYPSFCFCRVKSYCVTFFKRLSWKLLRFFLILWVCMLFLWAAWRILPLILCSWTYLRKIYQKFFSFYNRK